MRICMELSGANNPMYVVKKLKRRGPASKYTASVF